MEATITRARLSCVAARLPGSFPLRASKIYLKMKLSSMLLKVGWLEKFKNAILSIVKSLLKCNQFARKSWPDLLKCNLLLLVWLYFLDLLACCLNLVAVSPEENKIPLAVKRHHLPSPKFRRFGKEASQLLSNRQAKASGKVVQD